MRRGGPPGARPPRPAGNAGAGARAANSFSVTPPSPGSPTPLFAADPRPNPRPPPRGICGNAVVVVRATFAVMPPGQVAVPPAAAAPGTDFCHSILPKSVSKATTL